MTTTLSGPAIAPRNGEAPKRIVVLLHGYGSDGRDLIALGQHWAGDMDETLFVAPNAPAPCAINPGGYEWFPLSGDRIAGRIAGTEQAAPVIRDFLAALWEQTGLGPEQTVLVGFSQGAMMALNVGTAMDKRLKGIIAFSGAFIPAPDFADGKFAKPPVLLVHGDSDEVVDPQLSHDAEAELKAAGFDVSLHVSAGTGHGISPDGLAVATAFLLGQGV
ncbi:alpha/beta hydrolase [Devosia sp.]|uniref:alpha/beta hydrolase n=1 Tax=Devosia sp. TaxID=1871048 RepID=UPI003A902273